jgi:hypothetical protein
MGPVATTSCEIYNSNTKTWAATTGLKVARSGHGAVLLDDGRVFVAGGAAGSGPEVFDPSVSPPTWQLFAGTGVPIPGGAPVVFKLADGRVLIAGGADYMAMPMNQAFLYDPKAATGSEFAEIDLPTSRDGAAAAFLPDNSVMVVGGLTLATVTGGSKLLESEVLTPGATGGWTKAAGFDPTRGGISAFSTGKGLLVVGGFAGGDAPEPRLYDATLATPSWTIAPQNTVIRYASTNTLLKLPTKTTTDRVMVSGGVTADGKASAAVEIYDIGTGNWSTASSLSAPRVGHTVTVLADGTTLVAGGTSDGTTALKTAESFSAAAQGTKCMASGDCDTGFCTDGVCCAVASCGAGKECSADGSSCVATSAVSCTADAECKTGHCANGVCCDQQCDGVCQACNLSGSVGTCSSLGPTCLGEPADAAVTPTDAGTDGAPPTVHEAFTRCSKDAQCGTNHCVEGICCDTACTDRCHSCALSGSIGKCTVEPTGVDLKHECGPGRACLGTCSAGACVGSSTGTQCDAQKCTGASTGIGPATCEKAGGSCQTDKVAQFDCAPYLCEPAFGACRETCSGSDECTQGYSCDTSTQKCVANVPVDGGSSGCAMNGGANAGSFALALGIAALGLAARRRRGA